MATDEELIAAVASGDGRRLEELCRRWERPLYQLIARPTGGRDVEDLYHAPPARDGPTMTDCDDTLTALLFRGTLDHDAAAHLAACPRCRAERAAVESLARTLAAAPVPAPPLGLTWRLLAAAEPLLARNARRAAWPTVALALAAALLPLPAILLLDFYLVRAAFALLTAILPTAL